MCISSIPKMLSGMAATFEIICKNAQGMVAYKVDDPVGA